jgi:hypothetical protein
MKLLDIIDLVVDSKSNSVNCEFLRVFLNEIVRCLNLTDHSIELKNDDETVEYCSTVIDEKNENEKVSSNSNISRKSVESRFSNFDSSQAQAQHLQQSLRRKLSEKILCAEELSSSFLLKNEKSSLNAFIFDFINIEKRLDALEIGIRTIADAFEKVQFNLKDQVNLIANKQLDPDILSSLNDRIDWLSDKMRKFNCKCNSDGDNKEDNIIESEKINKEKGEDDKEEKKNEEIDDTTRNSSKKNNVDEFLLSLQSNVNDIRKSLRDYQDEENQFMKSVSKQLETFRSDLINCLKEIQDMMDCKLDKCFVPELTQLMDKKFKFIDEKIEEVTNRFVSITKKTSRTAAGTTKALIRDVNCVSCGDNDVVQSEALFLSSFAARLNITPIVGSVQNK